MGKMIMNGIPYGGGEVAPNPTGTPTDTLNTIGINNTIYDIAGGDNNVYGAFIDTNRVIQASTNVPANTDVTYTATEDCCLEFNLVADTNQGVHVTIDGVYIKSNFISSGIYTWVDIVYLRRGQTIKMRQSYTASDGSYTVYGLTFGTDNIFAPQIYSLEERCVGVYADGKPLYEKTFLLTNAVVNESTSATVPCNLTNVERVIYKSGTAFDVNDNRWYSLPYNRQIIAENLFVVMHRLSDETVSIGLVTNQSTNYSLSNIMITIQYTKTTDTAGSGDWTPSGVPAHHYSTDEQVVGTWIDGSTVYEKTIVGLNVSLNGNNWVDLVEIPNINLCLDVVAYSNDSITKKCLITEAQIIPGDIVQISSASGFSRTIATVVVKYTKTI